MHAPQKPEVPIITPDDLLDADGTRFGIMPAQVKHFWDSCGQLWANKSLQGKFCSTFTSTNSQHGGQETTHYTFLSTIAHFGMIYVTLGYINKHLTEGDEVIGGSPYGASVVAGSDGSNEPTEKELDIARTQGEYFAKKVVQFVKGESNTDNPPASSTEIEGSTAPITVTSE